MTLPSSPSADDYEKEADLYARKAKTEAKAGNVKAATYADIANAFAQLAMSMRLSELLKTLRHNP